MRRNSYSGYFNIRSVSCLILGLLLAACLFSGCGRSGGKTTEVYGTTDEMWGNEVDDAEIYAFMFEGRVYTADTIDEINPYDALEQMTDGGFYKLTADVKYLNGGIAGYVNYPDIKNVSKCEEISPLDLHLPSITEKRYGLCLIGDYADGDIYLNEYGKIAVWKEGSWIYRYDKSYNGEDGTLICCQKNVSEDVIKEGINDGVLSCKEYFVAPPLGSGDNQEADAPE